MARQGDTTDRSMSWKRETLTLPVTSAMWVGASAGTIVQVNGGVQGIAATDTATVIEGAFLCPWWANPDFPIGVKALVTEGGSTGTSVTSTTPLVKLDFKADTIVSVSAAATALDTVITALTLPSTPKGKLCWSSRGIKNAGWATRDQVHAGLVGQISCNPASAAGGTINSTNTIILIGLQLDFVPMRTEWPHSELDCPINDSLS